MSQQGSMSDVVNAIDALGKRLDNVEREVRGLRESEGKWSAVYGLHPLSTNLSNIREMFLIEIARAKGLLDGVDLDAIESKVRAVFAPEGESAPWGASSKSSDGNVKQVRAEIAGDYNTD